MRTPKELFNEIVKLADSLTSKEKPVEEELSKEVEAQVEAQEEAQVEAQEEVKEEVNLEDDMVEKETETPSYITKGEFEEALKEMKEMYAKVLEVISPSESDDVPQSLSSDEEIAKVAKDAPVVDLTGEDTDTIVHDPDGEVAEKRKFLYSQNRVKTTQDYVFDSIFNKKR